MDLRRWSVGSDGHRRQTEAPDDGVKPIWPVTVGPNEADKVQFGQPQARQLGRPRGSVTLTVGVYEGGGKEEGGEEAGGGG